MRRRTFTPSIVPTPNHAKRLKSLADDYWRAQMRHRPLSATYARHPGFDDRLEDNSAAGRRRQTDDLRSLSKRAGSIDSAKLAEPDRITLEVLRWQLELSLERLKFGFHRWGGFSTVGVDHVSGMQSWIPTVIETAQPMSSGRDVAAYLRRLRALPDFFRNHSKNLREGLRSGRVPAKIAVERTIAQLDRIGASAPEQTPFAKPLERLPERLRRRHADQVLESISRYALPAYREYAEFLRTAVDRARPEDRPGVCHLPDGDAAYRFVIRYHTTLDLTPKELHDVGLEELRGIRDEMARLAAKMGHPGGVDSFMEKVRTDPANFFQSKDEIVDCARRLVAETYRRLPDFFGTLPKTPLEVRPVEPYKEKNDVGARYSGPPADLSRPGVYWVNTHEPQTRSRFGMASLTAHEGVPGHHLQIALAVENKRIPTFQRFAASTAYVEGWALYSERLADEMGLYQDDLSRLGMLSNQAFRAARLAVDTGLHALGWTRSQAIDFMAKNTPMSKGEIESEIDRYTVWPGQALAYMAGQRELWRLRRAMKKKLGARFSLPAFHDAVLGSGPLPLEILRGVVERALCT